MPTRFTIPLVALVLFAAVGAVGFVPAVRDRLPASLGHDDVIKVVSSMPRSGSARGQTSTITNGLMLAFAEAGNAVELTDPATGQKKAYRIEYLDLDDATAAKGDWTIEQEVTNANLARNDPDVMAYVGTYNSGAAKVSMPILNRADVLMVSPANTAESLTKPGTGERHEPKCYRPSGKISYLRVVPTDDLQSELGARFMADPPEGKTVGGVKLNGGLGAKRVFILDDTQLYGKGLANAVEKLFKEDKALGVTVLGHEHIDATAQEYSALMTKIKALGPDAVYFGGTTQSNAGQLLKDMRKAGLHVPVVGPDGCYEKALIGGAGDDVFADVPFYATFGGLPIEGLKAAGGKGAEFVSSYAAKYGEEPGEAYASYGYECGLVVLEAFRLAGSKDRDAIREAALHIKGLKGATGTLEFDANGDTTNRAMSANKVVIDPQTKKAAFAFWKRLEK